ncbi:MAG TPA: Ldh family oxidoreductase, partial [Bacillota bacterium]
GFGQAMVVDALCGLLGGQPWATIHGLTRDIDQPARLGHFFMAIDISCFIDPGTFKRLVDQMIRGIRATPLAPGYDRIYSPGEPEALAAARYREGVPILRHALDELNALAAEAGIDDRLEPL